MEPLQTGQMLGPYRILGQVGQGGMATVYKAYHAAMDRYVALKVLSPEFARSEQLKGRFQQEARIIANLEHKHILPVHDFGESDGLYYFVMRFLDTGSLKERIGTGRLTLPEIDHLFSQLAEALDYAHQRGVIHRDIKPSNVLVDARGDVFLTDFGIAKLLEGTTQFTATNAITGTPAYMSPEQAQGEKLDARTDIYSLGVVLYEMITGRVPFDADTPLAVMMKHVSAPLPLPSQISPEIHPEIERVLLKALAKDRNDRFANCQEFLSAWKSAFQIASTARRPAVRTSQPAVTVASVPAARAKPAPRLPTSTPGRNRLLLVGGVAGFVLLIGIVLGGIWIYNQLKPASPATPADEATPVTGAGETVESTVEAGAPVNAEGGTWSSWTAGNRVLLVSIGVDQVFTAWKADVSIWNRQDGSLIRRLTTADGLPGSSEMNALLAEGDRALWIGMNDGLFFYDGQALKRYGSDQGLDSDDVESILRLRDNRLLIGTYTEMNGGGLNVFDGNTFSAWGGFPSQNVAENPTTLSSRVDALAETQDGSIWVGTSSGLGRWDSTSWTPFTSADGLPGNGIIRLLAVRNGGLLIGLENGAAIFDGQVFRSLSPDIVPETRVNGLAEDLNGRYWFTGDGGILIYNPSDSSSVFYNEENTHQLTYTMFAAATDKDGNVYIGSDGNGLVVFNPEMVASTWKVPNVPLDANFTAILPAPDGTLWFTRMDGSGADIFDPQSGQWAEPSSELRGFPLRFDAQGGLWMNEWPSGFWVTASDGSELHITDRQGLPPDAYVNAIVSSTQGETWLGTSLGVASFDGSQITSFLKGSDMGLPGDDIRVLFAASDSSLWVSSADDSSLARRKPDGSWEQFGSKPPFRDEYVRVNDIAEDASGGIWVATNGKGVYRYADEEWTQFTYADPGVKLPSPDVLAITLAPDGSLWLGTDEGAARFDGKTWIAFAEGPQTLVSGRVQDIFVDGSGVVYFATDGGVSRWKP